jgi:hypothetical protein
MAQLKLLHFAEHLQLHTILVIGIATFAIFRVCEYWGHVWCRSKRANTAFYFIGTPLLAISVWIPLILSSRWTLANIYTLGAVSSTLMRISMFSNKVNSMKAGQGSPAWTILVTCWVSMATFWAVLATYSYALPSMFLTSASDWAMCDSVRPLQDNYWECCCLCAYSLVQALHSLLWIFVNNTPRRRLFNSETHLNP